MIRDICNFGALDLPRVRETGQQCLTGNKFNLEVDASAVFCQMKQLRGGNGQPQQDDPVEVEPPDVEDGWKSKS